MIETPLPILLTAAERRLLFAFRAIPDSPLRVRVMALIEGLVHLAQQPTCADAQADGVPCDTVYGQCERCSRVFEQIHALVERSFPARAAVPA